MTPLSLQHINAIVPYQVTESAEDGFFEFVTVHDVHYSVGFMPDDLLMQEDAEFFVLEFGLCLFDGL